MRALLQFVGLLSGLPLLVLPEPERGRLELADDLHVRGELSLAGISQQVEATGRVRGPVEFPGGAEKLSVSLETTIDRTDYGMDWQMDLPSGEAILGNDVKLIVELELLRS